MIFALPTTTIYHSDLIVKVVVGAFSVITNLRFKLYAAVTGADGGGKYSWHHFISTRKGIMVSSSRLIIIRSFISLMI